MIIVDILFAIIQPSEVKGQARRIADVYNAPIQKLANGPRQIVYPIAYHRLASPCFIFQRI